MRSGSLSPWKENPSFSHTATHFFHISLYKTLVSHTQQLVLNQTNILFSQQFSHSSKPTISIKIQLMILSLNHTNIPFQQTHGLFWTVNARRGDHGGSNIRCRVEVDEQMETTLCLVGRVLNNKTIRSHMVQEKMKKVWFPVKGVTTRTVDDGVFLYQRWAASYVLHLTIFFLKLVELLL